MNCYSLGGHSGCQIILMENNDGFVFVRKVSKDIAYNQRLKKQCDKQAAFASKGDIKAPVVYNSGINEDGLFFFDMEYIQGITLAEKIKSYEIGKIRGVVEILVKNLIPTERKIVTPDEGERIRGIFSTKIRELNNRLVKDDNDIINQALVLLKSYDWTKFTPSQCHGDLTLENIIVKNDSLYFIDFLDSFYDSWLLDIGTLLQDVQVLWSYRFSKDVSMNTVLRLIVFRDILLDEIEKLNPDYIIDVYYALLQKLIRIFPYVKDKITYDFLTKKTGIVVNKINEFN